MSETELPIIELKSLDRSEWSNFDIVAWRQKIKRAFGENAGCDLTYLGSAFAAIRQAVIGDVEPPKPREVIDFEFEDEPTDYSLAVKHAGKLIEALIRVHDKNGNILRHPELSYAGGENKISYIDIHEETKP